MSLHDVFLVGWEFEGGFLRLTTERDLKGSEDQWSMSLQKFDIREFDVHLPTSSPNHARSIATCT
jgi:hypothetical protein